MKNIKITTDEAVDIATSLNYWANYIETTNIIISAQDAKSMGKNFNALDLHQVERVASLRNLAAKVLVEGEIVGA